MSEPQPQPSPSPQPQEPTWAEALAVPLGLLGAIVGGLLGGYVVKLAYASNLYAIPLIGLTVGYGTILCARRGRSIILTVLAILVCLAASLLTEWKFLYRFRDPSLSYFISHITSLPGFKLLCHGAAAAIAGWFVWSTPTRPKKSASE